jgi:hypothetical protein
MAFVFVSLALQCEPAEADLAPSEAPEEQLFPPAHDVAARQTARSDRALIFARVFMSLSLLEWVLVRNVPAC